MKNKLIVTALILVATMCVSLMSGCWVDTANIEFVEYPATTYYEGDDATVALSFTLKDHNANVEIVYANGVAKVGEETVEVEVKGFNLSTPGSYTAVVSYKYASLEFAYTVVAKDEKFAGGEGTAANPYKIRNAQQMQNISSMYNEGYKYYEIAPGVTSIDCTGWTSVDLYGSFNGNGVVFNNVTSYLFGYVGHRTANDDGTHSITEEHTVIENFKAVMNFVSIEDAGMVSAVYNKTTTFKNIIVDGYLEGAYNSGSFYCYGNGRDLDYTVNFENCESKATLVSTTTNKFGCYVGHTYANKGQVTLNFDSATKFTGTMRGVSKKMNAYAAILQGKVYVNGVEKANTESACDGITVINPTKGQDGYYVVKAENVTKIVVAIAPQLNGYDEEGNEIDYLQGITMAFDYDIITNNIAASTKVFELFNSVEIVNGDAELATGLYGDAAPYTLIISTGRSQNFLTGKVSLQVNQYDSEGNILACGSLVIGTVDFTDQD